MTTIVLALNIAIVLMPAQTLPCGQIAPEVLISQGDTSIVAAHAELDPAALAVKVWPWADHRIFCDGFSEVAP